MRRSATLFRLLLATWGCGAARARAQGSAAAGDLGACAGQTITRIDITPKRPAFAGANRLWHVAARAVGLHHQTTQPDVIKSYLLLREGGPCTELGRTESEHILRWLPFLDDASIRAFGDGAGGTRLEVDVTDAVPALVNGALRNGVPSAFSLGNSDIAGTGLDAVIGIERGFVYRNGGHVQAAEYAAFNAPVTVSLDAASDPLGSHIAAGIARPLLSNIQHGSWEGTFRTADDYPNILRPWGDNASVEIRQTRWSVSGLVGARVPGLVALIGGAILSNEITPAARPVVVTDSGLTTDADTTLVSRYQHYRATRIGALIGLRHIEYSTVSGYGALFAEQDVETGFQIGALAAPGLVSAGGKDMLIANSIYAGATPGRSLLGVQLEAEARRNLTAGAPWMSVIGSGRAAWYYSPVLGRLFDIDDEYSGGSTPVLPMQVTLSDPTGGIPGFQASRLAGARRNVTRAELRWARPAAVRGGDIAAAIFADAGTLWAGDAPYGSNVSRQSVGVSLLAAYPTRSKRLYRIDLAFPIQRAGTGGEIEVRFSSIDGTAAFWTEPNDVTRSRLGPVPSTLFAWPNR